jgi:hypothetical protein
MDSFEVREDGFSVEAVAVLRRVGEDCVGDLVLVLPGELLPTSRALLLVAHSDDAIAPRGYRL